MPKEIWDNVQKVRMAFKPNQTTETPILASPSSTVDIYSNILPIPPTPIAQSQQTQISQAAPLLPMQSLISSPLITPQGLAGAFTTNPYMASHAGLFQQGVFSNPTAHNNLNAPLLFNNQYPANYLNVMAAAQAILNNAAAYYNSCVPSTAAQQQRILSPQPATTSQQQILLSPHLQPQTQQQQQQQSILPYQSPQLTHNQIKRKPVQLQQQQQRPPPSISPQIEQRLQRKRSGRSMNEVHADPKPQYLGQYYHPSLGRTLPPHQVAHKKPGFSNAAPLDMEQLQRQLQQHCITPSASVKKKVCFVDQPTTHVYEQETSEDEDEAFGGAEEEDEEDEEDDHNNDNGNYNSHYYYNEMDQQDEEEEEQEIDEGMDGYGAPYYGNGYGYGSRHYPENSSTLDYGRLTSYQSQQNHLRHGDNYTHAPSYSRTADKDVDDTSAYEARDIRYQMQPLFHNQDHGRTKAIYKNGPVWRRRNA